MADYRPGPADTDPERTRPIDRDETRERRPLGEQPPFDGRSYRDSIALRRVIYARVSYVVWTVIAFIEAFIGLRVILKLIAANPGNEVVRVIYDISGVFVDPFVGIVRDLHSGNSVLEINALIAMLVYLLIGYAVLRIVWLLLRVTAPIHEEG